MQIFISKFEDKQLNKLNKKHNRTRRQNKRTRRQNKGIKTLIDRSNHSIKLKCLKWIDRKYCLQCKDMKNTQSKGCKDYTHNFKLQEVKMTNKVLREK